MGPEQFLLTASQIIIIDIALLLLSFFRLEHRISPVATIMQAIVLKALLAETIVTLKQRGVDPFTWTNSLQAGGIEANSGYMHRIWGRVKSM